MQHLLGQRADGGLGAALFGRERIELSLRALPLPGGQVRRVETLAAQQGADGAAVVRGSGLVEDGAFVLGGKKAANWPGSHLRIGSRRAGGRRRGAPEEEPCR